MEKNFQPVTIAETDSDNLLDKLNITEERADAITGALNERKPKGLIEAFQVVGEVAENQNEYALGIFIIGQHTAPNSLEALLGGMQEALLGGMQEERG